VFTKNYDAAFADTWAAVHTALGELQMQVASEERDPAGGSIEGRDRDGERVRLFVEVQQVAARPVTRLTVRVGTFGEEARSNRILNQVDLHLAPARLAAAPPTPLPQTPPPTWAANQTAPPPLAAPTTAPSPIQPVAVRPTHRRGPSRRRRPTAGIAAGASAPAVKATVCLSTRVRKKPRCIMAECPWLIR